MKVICIYDFGNGLYEWRIDIFHGCMGIFHQSVVVPEAGGTGRRLNDN
jgi:hypothetical protein